jgi:hypothetical protein
MRRVASVIVALALGVACLAGCGGSSRHEPAAFAEMSSFLHQESGGCPIATESLPRTASATFAGSVECKDWLSGWITLYEFSSSGALRKAVAGGALLTPKELYCSKGDELVVNELLGHDYTADFCRENGFAIHRPAGRTSSARAG